MKKGALEKAVELLDGETREVKAVIPLSLARKLADLGRRRFGQPHAYKGVAFALALGAISWDASRPRRKHRSKSSSRQVKVDKLKS